MPNITGPCGGKMDNCIFCKIANGIIPVEPVMKSEHCVMIADKNPIAPTHMLVIPKEHFDNIEGLHYEGPLDAMAILGDMFTLIDQYVEDKELHFSGYRIVINTGKDAGQTVHHLHIHLLGGATLKNDFGA